MPAAMAALSPGRESSITRHSAEAAFICPAANRNRSGSGLPRSTCSAVKCGCPENIFKIHGFQFGFGFGEQSAGCQTIGNLGFLQDFFYAWRCGQVVFNFDFSRLLTSSQNHCLVQCLFLSDWQFWFYRQSAENFVGCFEVPAETEFSFIKSCQILIQSFSLSDKTPS